MIQRLTDELASPVRGRRVKPAAVDPAVEPAEPWDMVSRSRFQPTIGHVLTPQARAGLQTALTEIDGGGLHFYVQRKPFLCKERYLPVTPQAAREVIESCKPETFGFGLFVSHDSQQQFPIHQWSDIHNLHKLQQACALAGLSAAQVAAAVVSLGKKFNFYLGSNDTMRYPLSPLRTSGTDVIRHPVTWTAHAGPLGFDVEEVLATDELEGSGLERGLKDGKLAQRLRELGQQHWQFYASGNDGPAAAYLSLSQARTALAEHPDIPRITVTVDEVKDPQTFRDKTERAKLLYETYFKPLVMSEYLLKAHASHALDLALLEPSAATAEQMASLLLFQSGGQRHTSMDQSYRVFERAASDHEKLVRMFPNPQERSQAARDLSDFRRTLSSAESEDLMKTVYLPLRQLCSNPQEFAPVRECLVDVTLAYRYFFARDNFDEGAWNMRRLQLLTDGATDGTLQARAQALRHLAAEVPHRDLYGVRDDMQKLLQEPLPRENVLTTLQRFNDLMTALTPRDRESGVHAFQVLQQRIATSDSTDDVVCRFLQDVVLTRDVERSLLRLERKEPPPPVSGVSQAHHEVVLNGVRVPRNLS